uniref:Uncharacterized protein n=1 Tax=Rhizophagus irregularis (strain DAOM 181602 / DAOM 197198 / MUCL 43194) TaxID=747089 RepID=U9UBJ7_RHIID
MHKEDVHWKFTEQGTKTILIKRGMKEKQGGMKGRQRELQVDDHNNQTSKRRRKVLAHEEQILERLLAYEKIPSHIYDETLQLLGAEWDKKRVWNYRVNKE